jgi:cytochrome c-type biogenesis protein CcmH/NrfG
MSAPVQQIVPSSPAVSPYQSAALEQPPRGAVLPLSALLRGRARDVMVLVAELKAELETWVEEHPHDYGGLVLLGELNLRIGLTGSARELLYRASLLEPPSWEAMQRTALLLRRSEAHQASEYVRTPGAPPPRWLRYSVGALASQFGKLARRLSSRAALT